jgi:tetrahydromethanopterin S-methyltransferase subunit H
LLDQEAEVSAATGNPRIIDVVGETGEALIKYIEFVAANTNSPILVDSSVARVRMQALRHFAKSEIVPRLVYSSIDCHYDEEEITCIRECGVKSAIVLAFGTKPGERMELLNNGLLEAAKRAGVENMLIDIGVLDVPSISWSTQAIQEVKEATGLPCGWATSNALYMWESLNKKGPPIFQAVGSTVMLWPISWGANFLLYGPIRNAPWIYRAAGALDAIVAYGGRNVGLPRVPRTHPLYKVFNS